MGAKDRRRSGRAAMAQDDPLKRVLAWIATAASLSFSTVGIASQNDPRLNALFERLSEASSKAEAAENEHAIWQIWHESGSAEIDRLKDDMVRSVSIALARPGPVANQKYQQLLYGDHPYGRMYPTEAMIRSWL